MTEERESPVWRRAVERAGRLPFFVAGALRAYQTGHGLCDAELARFLGCPLEALPGLALCRRPDTEGEGFRAEVERIAAYAGADPFRLAQLFCDVATAEALSGARPAAGQGFLMAARERPPDEPPTPPGQNAKAPS
jgi:hypothetical protein